MFESRHEKSIRAVTALLFKAHDALFLDAKGREDILKNPRVRELELAISEALKLAEAARWATTERATAGAIKQSNQETRG
jgi:hypothetical protein